MPLQHDSSVYRFYSLEYFYILLQSVTHHSHRNRIFQLFKELKQQYRLGESKFKKTTADPAELTPTQLSRYRYTFEQVIEESKQYCLIFEGEDKSLRLTPQGRELLASYGTNDFLVRLFVLMEQQRNAFRYIIETLYHPRSDKPGLLVLPFYSPYQVGFDRKQLRLTGDIREYATVLASRLSQDLRTHLGNNEDLVPVSEECVRRIIAANLIPKTDTEPFVQRNYNKIIHRFRKFWLTYFLNDVYDLALSLSTFDIWTYRGKQFGILHATDFYPAFHGRVVYPTSVLVAHRPPSDFEAFYDYGDTQLYLHKPIDENGEEAFIESLVTAYHTLRRTQRASFVKLASVREMVCYRLRISETTFGDLLNNAYRRNLARELRIEISLEVDKLPEDTQEAYLKQEPVMVDGKPRNIIAIASKR